MQPSIAALRLQKLWWVKVAKRFCLVAFCLPDTGDEA